MRMASGDTSKRRLMALILAVGIAPLSWAGPPDGNTVPFGWRRYNDPAQSELGHLVDQTCDAFASSSGVGAIEG